MRPHEPIIPDDQPRVIKFRPRSSDDLRDDETLPPDASGDPDDFRQRMWTNAAAFAVTVALAASGIWLAVRMSDLRTAQDCVLMGRRDCARVASQPPPAAMPEPASRRH